MSRVPLYIIVTTPGELTDGRDEQGNRKRGPDVTTTVLVKAFAPRPSADSAEPYGVQSSSGGIVYGFAGTEIPPEAIIQINGDSYQMDGEVRDWEPAYNSGSESQTSGVEFAVKRAS